MYIHRVIVKDAPGLPDRDLTFFDEWSNEPLTSALITGPNGTGKTTLLKVMAALWEKFANWLRFPNVDGHPEATPEILHTIPLSAVEIYGLIDQPLWLYELRGPHLPDLILQEARKADGVAIGGIQGAMISGEQLTSSEWFKALASRAEKLRLGVSDSGQLLPNLVFLEAEARQVLAAQNGDKGTYPEPLHRWLATYSATERWEGHIETMLRNLKVRDPKWFYETLQHINAFLAQNGKHLTDFDSNLRLMVESNGLGKVHYIDKLSSGEQQCLILIFMVSRWLMTGGVVLIDEPDLHMHVSWQRQFIHELEKMVREKSGQLIVTSHSPTFWEEYNHRQRINFEVEPQP